MASLASSARADSTTATQGSCDRHCLHAVLDTYLEAIFKQKPGSAPLAPGYRATANAVDSPNSAAIWSKISGYGELQRRYFDPVYETAAYLGLLKVDGREVISSVRIRVSNRQVSEAEWTLAYQGPGGHGEAIPAGMLSNPPPTTSLAPEKRPSRFMLLSLAGDYFQALQDHDGSWVPHSPRCERVENGVKTTMATPVSTGSAADSSSAAGFGHLQGNCLDHFEHFNHSIAELTLRRFPLVDEEAGVVLGAAVFVRYPGVKEPRNLINEYFSVRDNRIDGIWAVMYYLPSEAPLSSGWENR